jgi:NADH dehydrogenase [ubiquinone] 1 alpha subcomplex assembly factor 1
MKTILLILACSFVAAGCTDRPSSVASGECPPAGSELFLFSQTKGLQGWIIQDDGVMGGLSKGRVAINEAGNALFTGDISLENNGGFSSVQVAFDPVDVSAFRAIHLGLKGDGKRYQIRVESKPKVRHSYAFDFETSGKWEVIRIPFSEMYAIHHGDRLDLPNYPGQQLAHIQILIGNKTAESFELELDKIWLE